MKYLAILSLLLLGQLTNIQAQNNSFQFASISQNNFAVLKQNLDRDVMVSLPDSPKANNKENAKTILSDFLMNSNINDFKLMHQGSAKGDSTVYYISEFNKNGISYRMYTLLAFNGNSYVFKTIRINKK